MTQITPIVLCGGVGTRLWPMSRSQSPKQFHPVAGAGSPSFFQSTVQRHRSALYSQPFIVTAAAHRAKVRNQLNDLQCQADIIAEPLARNTGPAVLAAALTLIERDRDAVMLVLPSDHIISGDFDSIISASLQAAIDGRIVLFGIKPEYPETGYGYIVDGGAYTNFDGLRRVAKFVEKPEIRIATSYIATNTAYWASGISLFRAETIIAEFERFDPATLAAVRRSLDAKVDMEGDIYLGAEGFRKATNEPTERIIFERSSLVALAPSPIKWSDVGSWTSVHGISQGDEQGNVFFGDVIATGTENALVRSDTRLVAVVGVDDVIVVDTPDAVLVTRRGKCQDVKKIVESLKFEERAEAKTHRYNEHSWGKAAMLCVQAATKCLFCALSQVRPFPSGPCRGVV